MLLAELFWPLYDEYETVMDGLFDEKVNLYAEYMPDSRNLSDEKAAYLIAKFYEFDTKKPAMQKEYKDKFPEVPPVIVVGKFLQPDYRLDLVVALQKTSAIPLIKIEDED